MNASVSQQSPVLWRPNWDAKHLDYRVNEVIVAGVPNVFSGPLHWRIYLGIGPNTSVALDIIPGLRAEFYQGTLMIESKDYLCSNKSTAVYTIPAVRAFTVKDVLVLLQEKGRERYTFDSTGSGCRYWCSKVIGDIEAKGGVAPGSREGFENYIDSRASSDPTKFPIPVRKGTFY